MRCPGLKEKPAGIGNASGSKLLPSFDPRRKSFSGESSSLLECIVEMLREIISTSRNPYDL